jgi:hypothetical protein
MPSKTTSLEGHIHRYQGLELGWMYLWGCVWTDNSSQYNNVYFDLYLILTV